MAKKDYRKPNTFEIILLAIGLLIIIAGIILLQKAMASGQVLSFEILQTMFLWLILIGIIILVAVNENIKEEVIGFMHNHNSAKKRLDQSNVTRRKKAKKRSKKK